MFVDSHVHIHDCFELDVLLDSAARNLRSVGAESGPAVPLGCLALTEVASDQVFDAIAAGEPRWQPRRWSIRPTTDAAALVCSSPRGEAILLIAGRQIATSERLEVLALATTARYPDGRSLRDTLAHLSADGVPAVIPWGFGKWWLGRGRLLAQLVADSAPRDFFLGDNGGRPARTPRPRLLQDAERRGFRILPGTDPFPFTSQQRRAGSYGFVLDGAPGDQPAAWLRARLHDLRASPPAYGSRVNVLEFALLQLAMNAGLRSPRLA